MLDTLLCVYAALLHRRPPPPTPQRIAIGLFGIAVSLPARQATAASVSYDFAYRLERAIDPEKRGPASGEVDLDAGGMSALDAMCNPPMPSGALESGAAVAAGQTAAGQSATGQAAAGLGAAATPAKSAATAAAAASAAAAIPADPASSAEPLVAWMLQSDWLGGAVHALM